MGNGVELVLGSSEGTHHRLEHRLTKIHSLKNSNRSFEIDQQDRRDLHQLERDQLVLLSCRAPQQKPQESSICRNGHICFEYSVILYEVSVGIVLSETTTPDIYPNYIYISAISFKSICGRYPLSV